MKPATFAPFYGCLYPCLCDIAQKHGYAMALHGSMQRDLDLVAIPWTEQATDAETLVAAIIAHIGLLSFKERIMRDGIPAADVDAIVEADGGPDPRNKPHGRRAWSLHLDLGAYIDLSVMPRM